MVEPIRWRQGQVVDERFELLRQLAGQHASQRFQVWRAFDTHTSNKVVLKASVSALGTSAQKVRKERDLLLRLAGAPNVAVLLHSGDFASGEPWLTLEDHGYDLMQMWDELDETSAIVDLGIALTTATEFLHANGVVHCDIKPENIIVRAEGTGPERFTLIDLEIGTDLDGADQRTMTTVAGSGRFMDPEVRRDGRPSRKSDVYGIGEVLKCAFAGSVSARPEWTPKALLEISPTLDATQKADRRLAARVMACTDTRAQQRPSASSLKMALQRHAAGRVPPPLSPVRRYAMLAIAVVAVLTIAILGVSSSRRVSPPAEELPPTSTPIAIDPTSLSIPENPIPEPTPIEHRTNVISPHQEVEPNPQPDVTPIPEPERPEPVPSVQTPTEVLDGVPQPPSPQPDSEENDPNLSADLPLPEQTGPTGRIDITVENGEAPRSVVLSGPDGVFPLSAVAGGYSAQVPVGTYQLILDVSNLPSGWRQGGPTATIKLPVRISDGSKLHYMCYPSFMSCDQE